MPRYDVSYSRHYFCDLGEVRYNFAGEAEAATLRAKGNIVVVRLETERRTVLTRMKEGEAIYNCAGVIGNMAKLQLSLLERPLIGAAVTGLSARDAVVSLASTHETTNRLMNIISTYYADQRDKVHKIDRKLSAANAYVQAASTYLGRVHRIIGPYRNFQPPQQLPEVFQGEPFIMADFDRLSYQHLEAVAGKYDKTVAGQLNFVYPETLVIGHHRLGPEPGRDMLYQTESDVLAHVKLLYLQYELALATCAELEASEHLKRTMDAMRPHGDSLKGVTLRLLRVTNDLLATYQSINSCTPNPELETTHLDAGLLITGDANGVNLYHVGSLSIAAHHLQSPPLESVTVSRHEYMLAGDMVTRIRKSRNLQRTIEQQLRMIYNHEFIDYNPIARLPETDDRQDDKLAGIRNSFRSLLNYLE